MPDWLDHNADASEVERRAALQDEVLDQLRTIIDPDLLKDIVSLGFVKELTLDYEAGRVSFDLELTTPACPVKDEFKQQAESLLLLIEWVTEVNINLTSRKSKAEDGYAGSENAPANLAGVSAILAVSSGKGGVGKSTVSVNLAFALAKLEARVGIVDCDVFGPSLPKLVPVENPTVYYYSDTQDLGDEREVKKRKQKEMQAGKGGMLPVTHNGVKLMSYGYLRPGEMDYAAVRGPMASSLVYQMITQTRWGDLDFLIIDLPPGTGDIHLTVAQSVKLTGHIVVSEPHALSVVDVKKGLHMFQDVNISPLAMVVNKAFVTCPSCSTDFDHWDDTDVKNQSQQLDLLVNQFGIKFVEKFPLSASFSRLHSSDRKVFPFVNFCSYDHPIFTKLLELAKSLIREVATIRFAADRAPMVRQLPDGMLQISLRSRTNAEVDEVLLVPTRSVRLECRCAECVDEFTHVSKIQPRLLDRNLHVVKMQQAGNYAMSLSWSDGHQTLMAFDFLEKVARSYAASGGGGPTCGVEADW